MKNILNFKFNNTIGDALVIFDENLNLLQLTKNAVQIFESKKLKEKEEIEKYIFEGLFNIKQDAINLNNIISLETDTLIFKLSSHIFKKEKIHLLDIFDKETTSLDLHIKTLKLKPILLDPNDSMVCNMNFSTGEITGTQELMGLLNTPKDFKCTILNFRDTFYSNTRKDFDELYTEAIDKGDKNELIKTEIKLNDFNKTELSFKAYLIGFKNSKNESNVLTIYKNQKFQIESDKLDFSNITDDLMEVKLNKDFNIIYANKKFLKIIGHENTPLETSEFKNYILNFEEYYIASAKEALKTKKEKISFPCFLKSKSGSLHSVYISVVAGSKNGFVEYSILLLQLNTNFDLSHQLENSYYRLKTLVMKLNLGVLVEKPGRIIDFANKTFCELFKLNIEPQQLIGLSCVNAAHENAPLFKKPTEFISRIDLILKENKPVFGELIELKSGKVYSRDFIPLNNNNTDNNGLIWQYQDVTETTKKEKTLKINLSKEKGLNNAINSLVSTASHQLRTPISVVDSNIQLLQEIMPEQTPMQERIFSRINKEFSRFRMLLDDILIVEKLRAGKVQASMVKKNILPIINDLKLRSFQPYIDGRTLEIKIEGPTKPVFIDQHLFESVMLNLIVNAFKYSPEKRPPEVVINFNNSEVKIKVIDFGIGVPRLEQKKLFSNFFRASNARAFQGSGLGLSIAKEYITRMNGKLNFTSQENKGSSFQIELPLLE